MLMKHKKDRTLGLEPMARIVGYGRSGVEPEKFLLAPIKAVNNLLEKMGTEIADYDLLEMNTAFESQMLINKMELGLDMEKVNIHSDCLAFGHPAGAVGARLMTTLLYSLKRKTKRGGLVSTCLGGGNGIGEIVCGGGELYIAGGVESMSNYGFRLEDKTNK